LNLPAEHEGRQEPEQGIEADAFLFPDGALPKKPAEIQILKERVYSVFYGGNSC
jgi:hypothetical protein